jgi:hypothetical protein
VDFVPIIVFPLSSYSVPERGATTPLELAEGTPALRGAGVLCEFGHRPGARTKIEIGPADPTKKSGSIFS